MDAKKIASLFDNPKFAKWFGGSKVVDEAGGPRTMYHGTDADFDSFSTEKIGSKTDAGFLGRGFSFSSRPEYASAYATDDIFNPTGKRAVYPVHLSLKNPLKLYRGEDNKPLLRSLGVTEFGSDAAAHKTDRFIASGYDGVMSIDRETGDVVEALAFEPTQAKSIFNRGTYDPQDPNILKSALPYVVAGGGLMAAMSPSQAQAIDRIRQNDLPLEEAWNPVEAFGGGLGGGLKAAATGILPDGAMDWAFNKLGGLMSGGR